MRFIKSLNFILVLILNSLLLQAHSQNTTKALKLLDEKQFNEAEKIFSEILIMDSSDIGGNYGMSRIYSSSASGRRDLEKSLEHMVKTESAWENADSKAKEKFSGMGVSHLAIIEQRGNIERGFHEDAKKKNTIEAYDEFINRFPHAGVTKAAINSRNAVAYLKAQAINTVEIWADFCKKYPEANEISEAKRIRNEMATQVALALNSVEGYRDFLQNYADATQVPQIQQRLNAVAFEEAKTINTIEGWESYIRQYPTSIFLNQAKQQLEFLRE